jgi:hypothetical protein
VLQRRSHPGAGARPGDLAPWDGSAAPRAFGPLVNPDLGIDLSVEEVGRLPHLVFPVVIGPLPSVPPGDYFVRTYWTMSEDHNDGTCLDDPCWLPAGELLYSGIRFTLVP